MEPLANPPLLVYVSAAKLVRGAIRYKSFDEPYWKETAPLPVGFITDVPPLPDSARGEWFAANGLSGPATFLAGDPDRLPERPGVFVGAGVLVESWEAATALPSFTPLMFYAPINFAEEPEAA